MHCEKNHKAYNVVGVTVFRIRGYVCLFEFNRPE